MRLFLDACCLVRPFDDWRQERVRREAEAVTAILESIKAGAHALVTSDSLEWEIGKSSDSDRRIWLKELLSLASHHVVLSEAVESRAEVWIAKGLKALDALHLASAENGPADIFLTCDDRLMRTAVRNSTLLRVKIHNPLKWLPEHRA